MSPRGRSRQSFGRRARTLLSLLSLLKMSGNKGELLTSTSSLAQTLGVSQQTGSILLRELASDGLILRQASRKGERVAITPKAYDRLAQELAGISTDSLPIGAGQLNLRISGQVFTGKGEGAYYVSQKGYSRQIEEKLGFSPYLGTLNLRVGSLDELNKLILLYTNTPINLKGFSTRERAFGDVQCYRVRIAGIPNSALLRSDRTIYDLTTVELISDKHLRTVMDLKDGDVLTFSFPG